MPNRILKESILDSPTLARLPEFAQDQFPRLLLLVDDWGCLNVDPDVIRGKAYPKRPKMTSSRVAKLLETFKAAGMLFTWEDGDRIWGYWVRWDDHNYCNARQVDEGGKPAKHRRKTPTPPPDELNQYLVTFEDKRGQSGTKGSIPIPIPIPIPTPSPSESESPPAKENFGEFQNVPLTAEEHGKLEARFGKEPIAALIEDMSQSIKAGTLKRKYRDHYAALLKWGKRSGLPEVPVLTSADLSLERIDMVPETSQEEQKAWSAVMKKIEGHVDAHSFATWFRPTRIADIDADGIWTVAVPNETFADYLNKRSDIVELWARERRNGSSKPIMREVRFKTYLATEVTT